MIVQVKSIPVRHNGARHVAGEEFQIDKEHYDRLKAHVIVVDENDPPKPIEKMTVAELKEHAAENGIDLGEATKKEDILQLILATSEEG